MSPTAIADRPFLVLHVELQKSCAEDAVGGMGWHLAALGRMEQGTHVSSGRALGPGRAWPSMEEHTRLLWAAIFGAATGALGTHCLRHAEENSSPLPSVLSVGFLSLSRNSLHSPRAGGCPGCVPRVEWCQSLAGQGRAILHQESLSRLPPRSARSSLPS